MYWHAHYMVVDLAYARRSFWASLLVEPYLYKPHYSYKYFRRILVGNQETPKPRPRVLLSGPAYRHRTALHRSVAAAYQDQVSGAD